MSFIKLIITNLRRHRLRAFFVVAGIAFGVAAMLTVLAVVLGAIGKAANRYFSEQGAAYLPAEEAVFIANIYGMPGIGSLFAMPKMRKYPHRIMIADEEGLLDFLPQENGAVTVFELNEIGGIESITYWDPSSDVTPF